MSIEKRLEHLEKMVGSKYIKPKEVIKGGTCEVCKKHSYDLVHDIRCGPNVSDNQSWCRSCFKRDY